MRPEITTIVLAALAALAVVLGIVAYLKDPGLPLVPSLAFPILAGWLVHVFVQD